MQLSLGGRDKYGMPDESPCALLQAIPESTRSKAHLRLRTQLGAGLYGFAVAVIRGITRAICRLSGTASSPRILDLDDDLTRLCRLPGGECAGVAMPNPCTKHYRPLNSGATS